MSTPDNNPGGLPARPPFRDPNVKLLVDLLLQAIAWLVWLVRYHKSARKERTDATQNDTANRSGAGLQK